MRGSDDYGTADIHSTESSERYCSLLDVTEKHGRSPLSFNLQSIKLL